MPPTDTNDHPDAVLLAAYLEDPADLSEVERTAIEAHLSSCPECHVTLAELGALVQALSALPEIEPPRSFALTPAMVGQRSRPTGLREDTREARRPIVMQETPAWYARQMGALRWATAVAAVLFVLVLTADMSSNWFGGTSDSAEVAPGAAMPEPATAMPASAASATETPMPAAVSVPEATPASAEDDESTQALRTTDATQEEESAEEAPAAPAEHAAEPTVSTAVEEEATGGEPDDAAADVSVAGEENATAESYAVVEEEPVSTASEDSRTMSTSRQYWRMAQVGLAFIIVLLLAAMIALQRIGSRNRLR